MGIMICEVHGESDFVETCSHVAKQIDGGRVPHGRRFSFLGNLFVCEDCFHSRGFEKFMDLAGLSPEAIIGIDDHRWEALEAAYGRIDGRRCYCLKCIAELPPPAGDDETSSV